MSEPLIIWIMSVCLSLFPLFLTERHRSQNQGSLKSEERLSDLKELCAQLCNVVQLYRLQPPAYMVYHGEQLPEFLP